MDQDIFDTERPLLFSIAYRMLGSASDAEDVVHDAWLRFRDADQSAIRSPKAFVTTIITRLCLDRLKSCRATREEYIGPWLPEPVLTSELASPDFVAQQRESVTLAFLVLLETLSPEERAVFLLKDVFEYEHAEVGRMLGITAEHSRQLLCRAKARLSKGRPRLTGTAESRRALAERFAGAFSSGDVPALTELLAKEAGLWSDGGGKAWAARRPILGREMVIEFLVGLRRTAQGAGLVSEVSMRIEDVNCEPALVLRVSGRLESIFVFSIDRGVIAAIRVVRNPEKLTRIGRHLSALH